MEAVRHAGLQQSILSCFYSIDSIASLVLSVPPPPCCFEAPARLLHLRSFLHPIPRMFTTISTPRGMSTRAVLIGGIHLAIVTANNIAPLSVAVLGNIVKSHFSRYPLHLGVRPEIDGRCRLAHHIIACILLVTQSSVHHRAFLRHLSTKKNDLSYASASMAMSLSHPEIGLYSRLRDTFLVYCQSKL